MLSNLCRAALLLCLSTVALCGPAEYERVMVPLKARQTSPLSFGSSWQVLGPFQVGTREATWGADPLEYVGGFGNLEYDPQAQFRSSLPTNGIATWNITQAVKASNTPTSANASLSISYSNVDWDFLKVVYGWSAVQYQAWARGEIFVSGNHTQPVILFTDTVLEFWVDGTHYFGGDFFTFRKAPPVLHLSPGAHKLDLRLVRDVRAFGGILAPTIDVVVDIQQVNGTLELAKPGILLSDVVNGKIASPLGSVFLRNSGEDDVEVVGIQSPDVRSPSFIQESISDSQLLLGRDLRVLTTAQAETTTSSKSNSSSIIFVAGQTRPVAINVSLIPRNVSTINLIISYRKVGSNQMLTLNVGQRLRHLSKYEPHKITYLHPGGMASYAMLRPPARNATCRTAQRSNVPVLLALHGAGVEADSEMVTTQLDAVADLCAWVMYPTGVTPWSSDDWHNWGFADVEAAVEAIPGWIENVGWDGPGVDINRWIVTGHSNGGQGTWYAVTHRPDKVLSAAPLSGYASIQKYVPYELWQPADPRRTAIVSASLNSYRHEMLMANTGGIPIQQQHGQIDDNVPAYNSRLLAQQVVLAGSNSSYNELAGQNHYWEGVMTTPKLIEFYYEQARSETILPRRLKEFSFVVGDPGDMGSKSGIKVTNLQDPGQYGRISVKGHLIRTSNVLSLEFDSHIWQEQTIMLDGQDISLSQVTSDNGSSFSFTKAKSTWSAGIASTEDKPIRSGRQLGAMTAILRTLGPFIIQHEGTKSGSHIALQVSRNLHQYFQADANIVSSPGRLASTNGTGNVITIATNNSLSVDPDGKPDFPLTVGAGGVSVRDYNGVTQEYGEEARGAAFLRPLEDERLELVIWGRDEEGLRQAARIVPMVTGVGQPDFVVFGQSAKWKGVDGALAMGFFDHRWEVTASSVVS